MVTLTEFARQVGVSKQAVSKAVSVGRITAYDIAGQSLPADAKGRKFVKPGEAASAFHLSRARIDDHAVAAISAELDREIGDDPAAPAPAASDPESRTLITAKTENEGLKAELIRMRLARERGELVSRAAMEDALESAGRIGARVEMTWPTLAEEIAGEFQKGGINGLRHFLRRRAEANCNAIADGLAQPDATDAAADAQ